MLMKSGTAHSAPMQIPISYRLLFFTEAGNGPGRETPSSGRIVCSSEHHVRLREAHVLLRRHKQAGVKHLLRARSSEPAPRLLKAQNRSLELKFSLAAGRWSCSPPWPLHISCTFGCTTSASPSTPAAAVTKRLCGNVGCGSLTPPVRS